MTTLTKEEKEQKVRDQIERELAGDPTGYDVLLEAKRDNITKLVELVRGNPNITRSEISKKLGISMRTASRYLSVVRKVITNYVPMTDVQIQKRESRMEKMKQILKKNSNISISDLASKLNVSQHTVYKYFKMLREGS